MKTLEKQFKKTMYVGYETSMSPHIKREKKVMEYNVGWNQNEQREGGLKCMTRRAEEKSTMEKVAYGLTATI